MGINWERLRYGGTSQNEQVMRIWGLKGHILLHQKSEFWYFHSRFSYRCIPTKEQLFFQSSRAIIFFCKWVLEKRKYGFYTYVQDKNGFLKYIQKNLQK